MWTSDLFMKEFRKTVMDLMCPKRMSWYDVYGEEFEKMYTDYEKQVKEETIKAHELWEKILESQIETGTYMLYKDAATANQIKRI
jgi:ribonucleoside-diphosphate reductase alpha chain